jgi:hypothetical protein
LSELPETLIAIGDRALCNGGSNVTITTMPNSVKTIGTQAFMGCSNVVIDSFGGEGS